MTSPRLQRRLNDLRDEYDARVQEVDTARRELTKPLWDQWKADRAAAEERYLAELRVIQSRHDREIEPINEPFVEQFKALKVEWDAKIAEARAEEQAAVRS